MTESRQPYQIRTAPLPIVSAAYHEPNFETYTGLTIKCPDKSIHNISTGNLWDDMILARSYIKELGYDRYIQSSTVDNLIMDMPNQQTI